jgi:hypothetical protein
VTGVQSADAENQRANCLRVMIAGTTGCGWSSYLGHRGTQAALCSNTSSSAASTPCGLAVGANAPPSILHGFSQHEVFENEIAVAAGKYVVHMPEPPIALSNWSLTASLCDHLGESGPAMSAKIVQLRKVATAAIARRRESLTNWCSTPTNGRRFTLRERR